MKNVMLSSAALLVTALLPAQDSAAAQNGQQETKVQNEASARTDFDAFLARVAAKIRSKDAPEALRSFRARVAADIRTPDATAKIEVGIDYLAPVYLRTEVVENGTAIVRGRDRGLVPWQKKGDTAAYWLEGKERAVDREAVARDLAMAAGMTRFLYPDRVLAQLSECSGPSHEDHAWRRGETLATWRVTGIAKDGSDFPLAATTDFEGPLRVTAWFDKETLALKTILLEPLRDLDKRERAGRCEELRFLEHIEKDGILLPKKVLLRVEDKEAKRMQTVQSIELLQFRANPLILTKDFFKKPD